MKHCPAKYRPLVADLMDGKIAPAGRKLLLQELKKNPKFAHELAELYGDHLAMAVSSQPDRSDEFLKEVYSVTRWSGESREIARSIEQSEDGSERIINETISVTRWAGQSAQFIRNVEQALIPHKEEKARRKSWRRIIFMTAIAGFVGVCVLAVIKTTTPTSGLVPTFLPGENAGEIKIIRRGYIYGAPNDLRLEPSDIIRTGSSSNAQFRFADGSLLNLRPESELVIPGNQLVPTLKSGQAELIAALPPPGESGFVLQTPDARLSSITGKVTVAIRNKGTLIRVAEGGAHVATRDPKVGKSLTLTNKQEMTSVGKRAFEARTTDLIDDQWIADLNPVLWLDAVHWETIVLDKQGRVEKWLDRSKKRTLFFQNSPEDRPRLLERELNNRDAVYFASPKQILTGIRRVEASTIFAVCRYQGVIPQYGGLFGTLGDFGIRHTGKQFWYGQANTPSNDGDFAEADYAKAWVNGSQSGDASSGVAHVLSVVRMRTALFEKPVLGSYFRHAGYGPGSRPFHGIVCEIIVFHKPLSDDLRQNIEKHLQEKWGIQQ